MFDLFFTVFPAVPVVFKLGFEPTEACFYELTAAQYEEAWRQGHDRGVTLHMVLSPQGKTQPGEVVVVSEAEKASLLKAAEVIELYCQKSGKVFDDYGSKLRFVANLLPPVFAKDTDIAVSPVPVGRVYHSGCSDVFIKAGSLLFESSAEALLKRRKV